MVEISNRIDGENHGDVIQAGRDANVTKIIGTDPLDALLAVGRLRAALDGLKLPPDQRVSAARTIDELEAELRRTQPDREKVAGGLQRLTSLLKAAGSIAASGAALLGPIGTIAGWLGPLGAAISSSVR
jgi:hypothetical protein